MDSFIKMGQAMLLAEEGQQQIARAFADALSRGITRFARRVIRNMANPYPQD